jgi:hypothetical protein
VKTATGILKTKSALKFIGQESIHMNQSFLCESFSSIIDKTRRKNETINQTPSTSMDYEKLFGSEDSHPGRFQRLPCTLCPGKSL